ncbi:sialate O-acetylesterase [Flavobacterium fluviatile]|uniref:sialate O-acetylesterase n=1 Tax=Flavobacterium fluviatile TaxID=1862387 RepID=UPI0013D85D11|nr:sialate O-acetylesterase [Flavobacterium fluviatile]
MMILPQKSYGENLKILIDSYHKEFKIPNLPFVFGQINCPPGKKYTEGVQIVRNEMENVASTVKNTVMVKTDISVDWNHFRKDADNVHYNAEGQKRLGTAFANAYLHVAQ